MSRLISLTAVSWSLVGVNSKASSNSRCQLVSLRERESLRHAALGVELQQLVRHVAHLGFDAGLGPRPCGAAEPVQLRLGFARAAILLDQIQARQRHVQLGFAGVLEQHEVALLLALRDLAKPEELSDAVRRVNDVVARLEIGDIGREAPIAGSW